MFVFIGVGEKAGSGADVIVKGWEDQRWTKPVLSEYVEPERVEMVMRMVKENQAKGLSQDQVRIKSGVSWWFKDKSIPLRRETIKK